MHIKFIIPKNPDDWSTGQAFVYRDEDDSLFYGTHNAAGESRLLYHVKNLLNENGFDLIKKRMSKDGHLFDDMQQYLRVRSHRSKCPHIYMHNLNWSIAGLDFYFRELGRAELYVTLNVYGEQPDTAQAFIDYLGDNATIEHHDDGGYEYITVIVGG